MRALGRRLFLRASAVLVTALVVCVPAAAQDVTLTARDGGLAISGDLVGYDGEFYRIASAYGRLTVDAEGVVCTGPACPDLTAPLAVIRITGAADPGMRLLPGLFAAFATARGLVHSTQAAEAGFAVELRDPASDQPLARIGFTPAPPDAAIAALRDEAADLVVAGEVPADLRGRALALEALIPVVAAENPLSHVRSTDLAAALSGAAVNWQALGGPDMPIVLHGLTEDSDLQAAIAARTGAKRPDGPRHPDAATLAAAVARDPWALALTGLSAKGAARAVPLTDSCDFPLPATPVTIKSGDYPLTAPLFLLTPKRRLPLLAREFLEYLATDTAQDAIAAAGYIDRRPETAPLTEDGQRLLGAIRNTGPEVTLAELQRLAAAMTGGRRLSLTFRFNDGSTELDASSRENLEDLARRIAAGGFPGQRLTFAGFSDGNGAAGVNLALSRSRAEAVRATLRAIAPDLAPVQLPGTDGFGEALPMACDSTAIGRQINRRVELWLHPATP